MSTSRGKQSPTENFEEIKFSPQTGYIRTAGFAGPKEAIKPLISELAGQGLAFTYTCDQSPLATIRYEATSAEAGEGGEDGEVETPTTVWEYFANVAEIDVLQADVDEVTTLSNENRRLIRAFIADPPRESEAAFVAASFTGATAANARNVYALMLAGVHSSRVTAVTLRVSKLVTHYNALHSSISNSGRVFTTDSLLLAEPTIPYDLPPTGDFVAIGGNASWYGWFKKFPNVQQAGFNRWNISQEWDFGLWPVILYNTPL